MYGFNIDIVMLFIRPVIGQNPFGNYIMSTQHIPDVLAAGRGVRQQGCFSSILKIPAHFLNVGKYIIEVTVDKPGEKELFGSILLGFNITELMECQIGITMSRPMGVIHPKLDWQIIQNQ